MFYNFFARFWRNIRVISTPNTRFFGSERTVDSDIFSDVFESMRSGSLAECTQFLCARRAGFPEILQFLRGSLAQNLRDIDARRALFRISTHSRRSSVHTAYAGCFLGNFSARGAPNFREICNYFARVFAEDLRDLDILLGLFCILTHCRLSEEMQRGFCGLRNVCWPNACKFCARGAPKLRKFCNFFARFRRKICVISTPDARLFGCQRTHDLVKRFEDVMRVAAHAGRVHALFFNVRAAR